MANPPDGGPQGGGADHGENNHPFDGKAFEGATNGSNSVEDAHFEADALESRVHEGSALEDDAVEAVGEGVDAHAEALEGACRVVVDAIERRRAEWPDARTASQTRHEA